MEDNEIDDILNVDEDIAPVTELELEQAENIGGEMGNVKPAPQMFSELPELQGVGIPKEYSHLADRILAQYRMLPELNIEEAFTELSTLTVKSAPTPTLQLISRELQKIQAVKERLAEIITQILPSHTVKKRSVDILKESWSKFSDKSSVDKRKADAVVMVQEFESDYIATDALLRTATHIAKNLDSIQDNISRRITCMQLQLKMHDLGRTSVPDYEFQGPSLDSEAYDPVTEGIGNPTENSTVDTTEAEELDF